MQGIRGTTRKSCYRLKVLCKSRDTIASWITSKDSCAIALTLDSHRYGMGLRIANRRSIDEAFNGLKKILPNAHISIMVCCQPLLDDLRDDPRYADLVRRVESAKMD